MYNGGQRLSLHVNVQNRLIRLFYQYIVVLVYILLVLRANSLWYINQIQVLVHARLTRLLSYLPDRYANSLGQFFIVISLD